MLRSLIGVERQLRQRNAGLRTLTLGGIGAAAFVNLGGRLRDAEDEKRIISYVVSGIGFLGTGMIMKEGAQIRGAEHRCDAVGFCRNRGVRPRCLIVAAAIVAAFVLGGKTLLRPIVNAINRRPVSSEETQALSQVQLL